MRRTALMAMVALLGALAFPAVESVAPASAATNATYKIVNAYTYGAGTIRTLTVCIDGTIVSTLDTTHSDGPFTHAVGAATITVFQNTVTDCSGEPDLSEPITFPSGSSTILLYLPSGNLGLSAVVLPDDTSCTAAGMGRMTFRNGAGNGTTGPSVDIWGITPGGVDTKFLTDVAPGAQASIDLAAGTYTHVRSVLTGTTTTVFDGGDLDIVAAQDAQLYLYGGADGSVGGFAETADLTACSVATTTTEPPTTTTTAAQPVEVAPAFTG